MEVKNIVVVSSSPRLNANSDILANSFIEGVKAQEKAEYNVTKINLRGKKVEPCINCDYCKNHEGHCFKNDDMTNEYSKILETADVLVFATPLYYFTFNAQMKAFIERTYMYVGTDRPYNVKMAYLIVSGAEEKESKFEGIQKTFEINCDYMNWKNAGVLLGTGLWHAGDAEKRPELLEKAKQLGMSLTI